MLRLSSHSLAVETGRYHGVLNVNSFFVLLFEDDIDDEYHMSDFFRISDQNISSCTSYITRPSVCKHVQLPSMEKVKEQCNLGKS